MSPKTPLPALHDVKAEQEIGDGVREDTGRETAGAPGDPIEESPGDERGGTVGGCMLQAKTGGHHEKGEPRECANGHGLEILTDEITQQKSAPEYFLQKRDDHREPNRITIVA